MPEDLVNAGTFLLPADREKCRIIGGGNVSAGVRRCVEVGLAVIGGGEVSALAQLRDEIAHTTRELATLASGCAPSGADWVATPEGLPDPATLTAPRVVSCPVGVLLVGLGGALLIDSEASQILAVADDGTKHSQPLDLPQLARLAAELPSLLVALAAAGPGAGGGCPNSGMKLSRPGAGHLRVGLGEVALSVSANDGWRLAAELTALLARRLELRVGQALRAEAALQAPAAEPVDQEVIR
jgi:hypothetical protein